MFFHKKCDKCINKYEVDKSPGAVCLWSNSSETAGHIFTILGECVVLIPGMVLIYFLKVTHPLGAPQGVFDPLDAQGRRASKFNV